ncbi:hypothetical protein EB155_10895 [archaeon]|nr:hypothetical protein [archaeon]NDB80359.1 hypothetical protein [archaeon]
MGANKHSLLKNCIYNENGAIVEIGSGFSSTPELQSIAYEKKLSFFCVDVLPYRHEICDYSNYYQMSGEDFFRDIFPTFNKKIVAAYLDNFDWTWDPIKMMQEKETHPAYNQYVEYANNGVFLSNVNSAIAHLKQTEAIEKYCVSGTLLLYDDTWFNLNDEVFLGKGCAGIYYLLSRGWELYEPLTQKQIFTDMRENVYNQYTRFLNKEISHILLRNP